MPLTEEGFKFALETGFHMLGNELMNNRSLVCICDTVVKQMWASTSEQAMLLRLDSGSSHFTKLTVTQLKQSKTHIYMKRMALTIHLNLYALPLNAFN